MTTGEKIRKLRRAKELTQGQLGEKMGIVSQNVSDHERDKHKPTPTTLKRYAAALEVDSGELLPDETTAQENAQPTQETSKKDATQPAQREMVKAIEDMLNMAKLHGPYWTIMACNVIQNVAAIIANLADEWDEEAGELREMLNNDFD